MSTSILFTYLLLSSQYASSLPLTTNKTALNTEIAPSWVPEPEGRGTWKLLYSCVFTLILCVWTAIHLNIPPAGETWIQHCTRKLKWVLIGIFVPEIVVCEAWVQWRYAKRLCKELNVVASRPPVPYDLSELDDAKESDTPPKDIPARFSIVYAFYCIMGGLVVDVGDIHDKYTRMSLAPQGLLWLAKKGHLFPISDESIRDKSKANFLAKGLVCFQVTWLLLQCIAREASGYPLTVLELHTLVHVVSALAIYTLWFYKPLDIKDPTVIDVTSFKSTLALMLMRTEGQDYDTYEIDVNTGEMTLNPKPMLGYGAPESAYLQRFDPVPNPTSEGITSLNPPASVHERDTAPSLRNISDKESEMPKVFTISPRPENIRFCCKVSEATEAPVRLDLGQCLGCGLGPLPKKLPFYMELSPKAIVRWNLAAKDLGPNSKVQIPNHIRLLRGHPSRFLRSSNINTIFGYTWASLGGDEVGDGYDKFAILLLSLCYGGIHAAAWNFDFPTNIERMMWRVACISAIAGFCGMGVFMIVVESFNSELSLGLPFSRILARELREVKEEIVCHADYETWDSFGNAILIIILFSIYSLIKLSIILIPYFLLVRLFIVIESFISLRRVPIGVYTGVPWTEYIPHL
jgi:hypothetical protein